MIATIMVLPYLTPDIAKKTGPTRSLDCSQSPTSIWSTACSKTVSTFAYTLFVRSGDGAKHKWFGPANESTLWRINRDKTSLYKHPTQKALELAERAIRNSSKKGDIVFDPFLGSGTTLIAAAMLGRRCFGMEIEPRFCDCIVRRYIALAGEQAVSEEIAKRYRVEGD